MSAPTRAPVVTSLKMYTPDGFALAAELYLPGCEAACSWEEDGPFPAVLLSHMGGARQEAWGDVPALLQAAGFVVLTYDFRGHGRSQGSLDPPSAATDLSTALEFLRSHPQVDGGRIALVGASMGGLASVIVGAQDPAVCTVVAISTSPEAAGQYPGRVIDQLSPRPFLALGCDEDPITRPERVRQLYEAAGIPKRVVILECAAHANDILNTDVADRLFDLMLRWLNFHVKYAP